MLVCVVWPTEVGAGNREVGVRCERIDVATIGVASRVADDESWWSKGVACSTRDGGGEAGSV